MTRFLIAANGSYGDVHPFFGIAGALKKRGHDVTVLSNERYKDLADEGGFEFVEADTAAELDAVIRSLDPAKITSMRVLLDGLMLRPMRSFYRKIVEHHQPGRTVLVAFPLVLGARMAHDKLGIPFVSMNLAPFAFLSAIDPPRLGPLRTPSWLPSAFFHLLYWAVIRAIDFALVKDVNLLRRELGLKAQSRIWRWTESPQRIIGLFPDWFATPQSDWPAHAELTGFPRYDAGEVHEISPELTQYLDAGEPPIVFTAGSPAQGVGWFYKAAADTCRVLGRRGILVTRYREDVPGELPDGVVHARYEPFGELLPRSAALVYHGGVGTCAQALAAGIPHLVVPWGADQFDQAVRLEKLGVGAEVSKFRFSGSTGADALSSLLSSEDVALKCKELAAKVLDDDAITTTCERLEAFAAASGVT